MKLELNLSKNDFLQYQLYKSSKMRTIKIQRIRNSIIVSGLVFLLGIYFFIQIREIICIIFTGIISLIIYLVYSLYFRIFYKRHFSIFIDENYKNQIGKYFSLEIIDNYIQQKDSESEFKIDIKEIKEIVEIQTNYFVSISEISSIILPKNTDTKNFINILIDNHKIKLNEELNWKWK